MASILSIIAAIATAVSSVFQWLHGRRERKAAVDAVKAEVLDKELKASNAVSEVLAEHRPDDDGARRLRTGDF